MQFGNSLLSWVVWLPFGLLFGEAFYLLFGFGVFEGVFNQAEAGCLLLSTPNCHSVFLFLLRKEKIRLQSAPFGQLCWLVGSKSTSLVAYSRPTDWLRHDLLQIVLWDCVSLVHQLGPHRRYPNTTLSLFKREWWEHERATVRLCALDTWCSPGILIWGCVVHINCSHKWDWPDSDAMLSVLDTFSMGGVGGYAKLNACSLGMW